MRKRPRRGTQFEHFARVHGADPDRFVIRGFGSRNVFVQTHQAVRILVWQRLQQYSAHDAEDRGIGADTKRQRDDRDNCEPRRAPERPRRIVRIAPQVVEPHERSRVAVAVFRLLDAVEGASCRGAGVVGRKAPANELVLEQGQMRVQLPRKVRLRARRTQGIQQSKNPPADMCRHDGSLRSSLLTRLARRRQRAVCRCRARAPHLVMA